MSWIQIWRCYLICILPHNFEIIIDGFAKIKASEFHFDQGLFKRSRVSLRLFKRDIEKKDFYQSNTKSNKFSAKFKIGK